MAIVRTGAGVRLPRLDGGEEASPDATEDDEEEESRATPSQESEADGFSAGGEDDDDEDNGGGGGGEEPEEVEEEDEDEPEEEEEEEEEDEGDSGMGSDELDVAELGEPGAEMCQVGEQSVAVPLELYDLASLGNVLSLDVWNTLLSEDERLHLATLLPDMDQETFARTLVELLAGQNFHFGSPLAALFECLKGGLCDPRVNLYRRGTRFAELRKHYYWLQSYHNSMVQGLREIKDCWKGRAAYSLDERLRMLDTLKAQKQQQQRKALDSARRAGSETDSESRGSGEQVLARLKHDKSGQKKAGKLVKEKSKGLLRVGTPKGVDEEYMGGSGHDPVVALSEFSRQDNNVYGYDSGAHRGKHHRSIGGLYSEDLGYERDSSRSRFPRLLPKPVKKKELATSYDGNLYGNNYSDNHTASPYYYGRNPSANQGVTLAAAYDPPYFDTRRNARYSERDWVQGGKGVHANKAEMGDEMNWPSGTHSGNLDDWQIGQSAGDFRSRKDQAGYGLKVKSYKSVEQQVNDARVGSDPRSKISQAKMAGKSSTQLDRTGQKHSRSNAVYAQSEETESDSSEKFEDGGEVHYLERKTERHHSGYHRPAHGAKKSNKLAKVVKMNYPTADADLEPSQSKGFKGKVSETGYLRDVDVMMTEQISDVMKPPAASGERKRKGVANLDMHVYDNSDLHEVDENANDSSRLAENERLASRSGHAVQDSNGDYGGTERVSSSSKKAKGRVEVPSLDEHGEHLSSSGPKVVENIGGSKKKIQKKPESSTTDAVVIAEPAATVPENNVVTAEPEKPEKVEKPKKKYVPITPTIHTGFSFSVVHLLTAIKKAMVTPAEGTPATAKQPDGEEGKKWLNSEECSKTPHQEQSTTDQAEQVLEGANASAAEHEGANATAAEQTVPINAPALTVQEIVNRIRANPGDPRILETQEPLQDLVRGVLKVLSSRTAPLGAKQSSRRR